MSKRCKIRVLLVDDHLAVRLGLKAIIDDQPDMAVIAEAGNSRAALEMFARNLPDIVLLDLRMPGLGGVEFLKQLRLQFPEAKVIVLTTSDREEDIFQSIEAGARGYLLKDMRKEDLLEAVRNVNQGERWLAPAVTSRLTARLLRKQLNTRETEILKLIVQGKSNKEIAASLSLSEDTIKWHLKSLFEKLEVTDRTQAAVTAIQRGVVQV